MLAVTQAQLTDQSEPHMIRMNDMTRFMTWTITLN